MQILRNKTRATQILILYELYIHPQRTLTGIAQKIGITQQAVSDYMQTMIKQKLVIKKRGEYQLTMTGIQLLHTEMMELKEAIDKKMQHLRLITQCVAIAKNRVEKHNRVGLVLEQGWLTAIADKKTPSMGTAHNSAQPGEYVSISELSGILDHSLGKIILFQLPSPLKEPDQKINHTKLIQYLHREAIDKLGVLDVVGKTTLQQLNKTIDFEFGTIHACIDAAERGVSTALFGYDDSIHQTIKTFDEYNASASKQLTYNLFTIS